MGDFVPENEKKVFVISEAGVNHNGNPDMAFKLIEAGAEAGSDAIKFQTFKAESLVTKSAAKAEYQKQTTDLNESQFAMLKRLELNWNIYPELISYCEQKGVEFLSTAFDQGSLDFLVHDLGLKTLKIPSGEMTNGPLLLAYARTGCDLIVSTGMATFAEVEQVLGLLAYGLLTIEESNLNPSFAAFQEAFHSVQGQKLLQEKVTLLHCTTEYPAPFEDINLNAMITMRNSFGLKIGYSDHSEGITVPIAAAALGAKFIEKHFTLDKALSGPDHQSSLDPKELKEMISSIRIIERIMGDGLKEPRSSEFKNRSVVRKSLVAATNIKMGEYFSEANLTIKRPGTGRSPMEYWEFLEKQSYHDYMPDEVIR